MNSIRLLLRRALALAVLSLLYPAAALAQVQEAVEEGFRTPATPLGWVILFVPIIMAIASVLDAILPSRFGWISKAISFLAANIGKAANDPAKQ